MKKKVLFAAVLFLFLNNYNIYATASNGNLNLLVESITNREHTSLSITDTFGLNLFTDKSIEYLRVYEKIEQERRAQQESRFFGEKVVYLSLDSASTEKLIMGLAEDKKLFYYTHSNFSYAERNVNELEYSAKTIIFVIIGVCVIALFLSVRRNKKKKKKAMSESENSDVYFDIGEVSK